MRDRCWNLNYIRHLLGPDISFLVKRWIDLNYKIIRVGSQLSLLKSCRAKNIIPRHIVHSVRINVYFDHFRSKRKLEKMLNDSRNRILKLEIFDLHRNINSMNIQLLSILQRLSNLIPVYTWNDIFQFYSESFYKFKLRMLNKNKKKLDWLEGEQRRKLLSNIKPINYNVTIDDRNNIFWNYNYNDPENDHDNVINITLNPSSCKVNNDSSLDNTNEKWFINLSSKSIPTEVSNLLQLGEGFCLPTKNKKNSVIEFIKDFESNVPRVNNTEKVRLRNTVVSQLNKFVDNKSFKNEIQAKLNRLCKSTIDFCNNNQDILFTKADKGNVTVALDRSQYNEKVNNLLKDPTTYSIESKNPVKKIESNLNNLLNRWLNHDYISKKTYLSLRSSDCPLPKAYALPKIHKKRDPISNYSLVNKFNFI